MPRTGLTVENAKELYADLVKLSSDYWILEGSFSGNALFIAAKISNENILEMENDALCLINSLTEKARSAPSIDGNDDLKFNQVKGGLIQLIKTLSALRVKLEGPTWYNYATDNVHYQLIGNQPNPGQTGSPAPKRPKRRKAIRAIKLTVKGRKSSVNSMIPGTRDDAAEGLVALASSSKGKQAERIFHNTYAPATPSPLAAPSVNRSAASVGALAALDNMDPKEEEIAQLRAFSTKSRADFATAINYFQDENIRLEKKFQEMVNSHNLQVTEKNQVIAEKDRVIAHKDMLIGKHKMALLPQDIEINDENGEIRLGNIGKRGFVEDWEADRVRDLKKQKTGLNEEVRILAAKRNELSAQIKELKGKGKSGNIGAELQNGAWDQNTVMNGQSVVGAVEVETSVTVGSPAMKT